MSNIPTPQELRNARQDAARKWYFGPILLGAMLRGQARRKARLAAERKG
jgi:hypothetical protein